MFVQSSLLLCLSILFFLLLRLLHCGALLEELTKSRFPFLSLSLSLSLSFSVSVSLPLSLVFFRSYDVEHYDKFFSFSLVGCRTHKSMEQAVRRSDRWRSERRMVKRRTEWDTTTRILLGVNLEDRHLFDLFPYWQVTDDAQDRHDRRRQLTMCYNCHS